MSCLDDATVLGLVEGRLAPELIARVDEHIDSCASCRDVVTLVASSRSAGRVLARGDTLDRYVIGDLLGSGAMGRVYSAWEPELDRRVAIKVLHSEGDRDRLVKEAQAMARLNHPNVVTVHEVGSTDDGVFVAMELVDGETLRAWAARPREWREVVRMLVDIARGLAAVHAAGVVHRDIKPDNVIVGADGRVRLGDFGLARSGASSPSTPPVSSFALGTLSGGTAVAGTPAYMAPEVLRGGAATAASDQFSFGVLAYELLAGKRPFDGGTWADLLRALEKHDQRPVPEAPRWLDDVVQRCIAVEPAARHKSMLDVAETLAQRLSYRRPTLWIAGAAAAALLASGATWLAFHDRGGDRDAAREPEITAVWNPGVRAKLVERGATPPTIAAIEHWTKAWTEERVRTSRNTDHANADRVAARDRCLAQRRDDLGALLDASRAAPQRLLDAVSALPAPAECWNADADPLPADKARADIARDVIAQLPALRAQIAFGAPQSSNVLTPQLARAVSNARGEDQQPGRAAPVQPSPTDEQPVGAVAPIMQRPPGDDQPVGAVAPVMQRPPADEQPVGAVAPIMQRPPADDMPGLAEQAALLVARARESGHAPTLADALLAQVDALRVIDRSADAALAARDAVAAAERGHADLLRARAWLARVAIAGESRDLAAAEDLGAVAQATIDRVGAPQLAATLARLRGLIAYNRGDLEGARSFLLEARTQFIALGGERTLDIAAVDSALGSVARAAGNLDQAEGRHRSVLALDRELRGANHRDIARDLHNIAGVLRLRGDLEHALATYREALAVEVATQGERSVAAALTHNSIGLVELARKDFAAAKADFAFARDALTEAHHGDRAFAEHNLGLVEQAQGNHKAALDHFDKAAAIYAATIGKDAPAAVRLVDDRATSTHAIRVAVPRPVNPAVAVEPEPAKPTPPAKKPLAPKPLGTQPTKDVGVYGSAQSW